MMTEQMPEQMPETEQVEASPEEEATMRQYTKEALKPVAANSNVWQGMLKAIRGGQARLPETIAMIAVRLYTMAEQKLGPLDDDDISEAVAETVIEQLLVAAVSAGIISEKMVNGEAGQDLANEIYLRFVKMWTDQNPERVTDEDRQLAKGGQGAINQQQAPAAPAPAGNILGA